MKNTALFRRTQIANLLTPAGGWLLSVAGLSQLVARATQYGDYWKITSCIIYGVSLVLAYAAFTLYHYFKYHPRHGTLFRILDHAAIYLLIAGSYTPFTLVYLRGHGGWTLFIAVWIMAIAGIVFKCYYVQRFKVLAPLLYLFMGWMLIFFIEPAMALIPADGLRLIVLGGLCYSSGLIFYAWKSLRFHHAVWHLFVLAGSASHYLAIYQYVIPANGG